MNEEVKKIIEMATSGKVTSEQAAELIESLQKDLGPSKEEAVEFDNLGDFINKTIQKALNGNLGKMKGKLGNAKFSFNLSEHNSENSINLSKVEQPKGEHYEFAENEINKSSLKNIELEHDSTFIQNSINASSLSGISLNTSEWLENEFHGSSFESITFEDSTMSECQFHGTKVSMLVLQQNSELLENEVHGTNLKTVTLSKSNWSENQFHGAVINKSTFNQCKFVGCESHGTQFENSIFSECNWNEVQITNCHFENVQLFNVNLTEAELTNINLKDIIINGEEEFKSAIK